MANFWAAGFWSVGFWADDFWAEEDESQNVYDIVTARRRMRR